MNGPRRLAMGLVVLFAVVVLEPAAPAGAQPGLGQPCQFVERNPVSFAKDGGGTWTASFAFAGGATYGHLRVPAGDAHLIADDDAYVADVRLGSYEARGAGSQPGGLVCRVEPTYHFFCPANRRVDQLCLTWVHKRSRNGPSAR